MLVQPLVTTDYLPGGELTVVNTNIVILIIGTPEAKLPRVPADTVTLGSSLQSLVVWQLNGAFLLVLMCAES